MIKSKTFLLTIIAILSTLLIWQSLKSMQIKPDISDIQSANQDTLINQEYFDKSKVNLTDSSGIKELSSSNDADSQLIQILDDSDKNSENSSDVLTVIEETQRGNSDIDESSIYNDEWEYVTETTISDVFYTHEYLSDLLLESIECELSVCKLKINKNSEDKTETGSLTDLHQVALVEMALEDMGIEIAQNKPLEIKRVDGSLVFVLHDPKI